jgi:uncharacterized protein (DUF433 family)
LIESRVGETLSGFLFALYTCFAYVEGMTVEQRAKLGQVVWIDPDRMSGTPCFTGTRVPVQMLLDHLKHGETIEDFLEGAPTVSREQAELFLELASERLIECVSS